MPEPTLCDECHAPIISPEDNRGSPTRPLCYDCWTEIVELRDALAAIDEDVERRR